MSEGRAKILQMLADGKITADEAARLLDAVQRRGSQQANTSGRVLRIRVCEEDGTKVSVNLPLALLRIAMRMIPGEAREKMDEVNIDIEEIVKMVEQGAVGELVEVESGDGTNVHIFVDGAPAPPEQPAPPEPPAPPAPPAEWSEEDEER
jgi:hypothetical protein